MSTISQPLKTDIAANALLKPLADVRHHGHELGFDLKAFL
jgi:hypothetical protein